jgi:hypothetical protein
LIAHRDFLDLFALPDDENPNIGLRHSAFLGVAGWLV